MTEVTPEMRGEISYYDINVEHTSNLIAAEYEALAEFRYQIRRFLRFSEQSAREHGIEPQQHQLLLAIKGAPSEAQTGIAELSRRLMLRHHSTVGLVDRCGQAGFVYREPVPGDRRAVRVRLTPAGEAVLRKLSLAHRAELQAAGPELVRTLRTIIRRAEIRGSAA